MICLNPFVDKFDECSDMKQQFFRFRSGRDCRARIVDFIAFATAGVEVIRQVRGLFAKRQLYCFERKAVVAGNAGNAIARARDCLFAV